MAIDIVRNRRSFEEMRKDALMIKEDTSNDGIKGPV
jgi:hypothetical protein